MADRVTQVVAEVLTGAAGKQSARVSQIAVEVLSAAAGAQKARVSQFVIEALTTVRLILPGKNYVRS